MKIKLNLCVFAISFALFLIINTGDVFAQPKAPVTAQAAKITPKIAKESHGKFRAALIENMLEEGKKFKLELNEKALTIISNENLTTAFMPIAGREKLAEGDFQKGATTGILYIESENRMRIPNGIYRVQVSLGPKSGDGKEKNYVASLLNMEGRVLIKTELIPMGYIVCWVNGINLCDPLVQMNLVNLAI